MTYKKRITMDKYVYIIIGVVFNESREILGIYDKIEMALIRQEKFDESDYDDVIVQSLILNDDINPI